MLNDPRSPKHFLAFLSPIKIPEIERVRADLQADDSLHIFGTRSIRETAGRFLLFRSGAIITYVTSKEDVKALNELARMVRSKIDAGKLKIVVFTQFDFANLSKLVRALGMLEFKVTPGQNERLKMTIRSLLLAAQVCEKIESQKNQRLPTESKTLEDVKISFSSLSQARDDCWLIDFESFHKSAEQISFEAIGPSLALGDWQEVTTPVDALPCWKFIRRDSGLDSFISEGHWIFYGSQPEFKNSIWTFKSQKPELTHIGSDGATLTSRIKPLSENEIIVSQNPNLQQEKLLRLMMSLDYSITLSDPTRPPMSFAEFSDPVIHSLENQGPFVPLSERVSKARHNEYGEYEKKLNECHDKITPSSDRGIISELLDEITGTGVPVLIWTPQQTIKEVAPHLKFHVKTKTIQIPVPPSEGERSFAERLLASRSKELLVSAGLRRMALFFSIKSSDLNFVENTLQFTPPESIYRIQRRKAFRLPLAPETPFVINVRNVGELMVRDISSTGICIIHPGAVNPQVIFQGQILPELAIEIDNQVLQCPAEIRWVKTKHTPAGKPIVEIGAQFFDLNPAIAELIRLYVFEESLKYLQKYVRIG